MSSDFVDNGFEAPTVNWMLEDFPADVKQKCKEQAILQRQTLKAFVETALRAAVGTQSVTKEAEHKQRLAETNSSPRAVKPVAKSRDKSSTNAKPRAS
jgi:hypothetical protein